MGPAEWDEHTWDDLLSQPGDGGQTLAEVRRQVGLPTGPEPPRRRDMPDVGGLAEGLGLT